MTTSGMKPRATSAGSTSAALPSRPIERGDAVARRSARARVDRLVQVVGALVEVAGRQALLDARRIDLDDQRDAAVHRDGQRLGAAHAAEAGGDDDACRASVPPKCRRASSASVS